MKTIEQFEKYYEESIKPKLEPLESERLKVAKRTKSALVFQVIIGAVLLWILRDPRFIVFYIGICSLILFSIKKSYVSNFKDIVITSIVKFAGEDLRYMKNGKISSDEFRRSDLYSSYNRYSGEDYVEGMIVDQEYLDKMGKVRGTNIKFSEINATRVTGSGKNRREVTIFNGMFYIADFNKSFKSYTKIIPDYEKSWFKKKERVVLEDKEFEDFFEVYSEDQIESRYILSTSLMQRLVDFRKKVGKPVHIAFKENKIYIGISTSKNLFEPNIFKTLYDFKPMEEYYRDLMMVVDIVEELNLNLKIWSKV